MARIRQRAVYFVRVYLEWTHVFGRRSRRGDRSAWSDDISLARHEAAPYRLALREDRRGLWGVKNDGTFALTLDEDTCAELLAAERALEDVLEDAPDDAQPLLDLFSAAHRIVVAAQSRDEEARAKSALLSNLANGLPVLGPDGARVEISVFDR